MPLNPRKGEPFAWDGEWASLPPVLTAKHMAAVCGVTTECIWDRIQRRTMRPKPDTWMKPYRWLRNRVQAELGSREAA